MKSKLFCFSSTRLRAHCTFASSGIPVTCCITDFLSSSHVLVIVLQYYPNLSGHCYALHNFSLTRTLLAMAQLLVLTLHTSATLSVLVEGQCIELGVEYTQGRQKFQLRIVYWFYFSFLCLTLIKDPVTRRASLSSLFTGVYNITLFPRLSTNKGGQCVDKKSFKPIYD